MSERQPLIRRLLAGWTLRGRLISGLVALLAIACATVGTVTYFALRGFLLGQLDGQLAAASARFVSCVNGPQGGGPPGGQPGQGSPAGPAGGGGSAGCANTPGQGQGTFSATLRGGVVTAAWITQGHCDLATPDRVQLSHLRVNGKPYTVTLAALGAPYRLIATPGRDGTVLVSGLSASGMNTTLRDVELTELTVFSAALLATGVLGTGWVRLSLRPLRRVTSTAAQVAELPLASGEVDLPHRVPDADPRTEVGQLGAAFNRMLGHVESALARRQASEDRLRGFAADASHELRTPLASIRGYAELARRHPGPLPPDVATALGRVESEAARMSTLVDDLLLLARLDAGRPLERSAVDLSRLAIDATSDARAAGPGHRWRLELPADPVLITGDENRLRQVLANLLANAQAHTPPGTTVTVALRQLTAELPGLPAANGQVGAAELSVTDDGPGIPADLRAGLFERFVRGGSSRSRASGGTGLGLAIVAAVVGAHGGQVRVDSQPRHTRFTVMLPPRR